MSRTPEAPAAHTASGRRPWLLAFLGFFLLFGAWSFAAPFDGPADEVQHVIRAVGVVSGQVAPAPATVKDGLGNDGMGAYQEVPRGLLNPAKCWGFNPGKSVACAKPLSGGPIERVPTSAGRYNPAYYAVVGLPLRISPNWTGLVLSRLISSVLSALLLASAFTTLLRWSRHGLMLAGLLAATTPMLAHLVGAVNPNGLEISAGVALFCSGIPLLLGPARGSRAPLIWLLGTSAVTLATLRSLGPLWLGAGLFALLVPQSRAYLRELWNRPLARRWALGIVGSVVLSAAWIIGMKTGSVVAPEHAKSDWSTAQASLMYFGYWGDYLKGMVGVAGWFDIFLPDPFYYAWVTAAAGMVLFALVVGGWRDRWRFFVMFVGGVIAPGVLQVMQANTTGFIIGGRYMMPLLVGMPLLAAFILERDNVLNRKQSTSMTRVFCVLLLPIHMAMLVYSMMRWQKGLTKNPHIGRLNPLTGSWHPETGSLLPVLLMVAALLLLGWVFWRLPSLVGRSEEAPEESENSPAGEPAGPDERVDPALQQPLTTVARSSGRA
ncbi:DUF2142 domain-containing protein [Longispora sp. K20-0274]|uniref:DUF2142 domain-containing protein n=1 Tax=Longispora sp. K20-0274 TaxID=3088255 RepID=UPI00399B4785